MLTHRRLTDTRHRKANRSPCRASRPHTVSMRHISRVGIRQSFAHDFHSLFVYQETRGQLDEEKKGARRHSETSSENSSALQHKYKREENLPGQHTVFVKM